MNELDWISMLVRKPTEADADNNNEVVGYENGWSNTMVIELAIEQCSHWLPLPKTLVGNTDTL